jgi:hypothetical protein
MEGVLIMLKSALVRFGVVVTLLALALGGMAVPVAAQDAIPFSTPNNDRLHALSPEGTMIATTTNGGGNLCIFTVPDAEQVSCTQLPGNVIRIDPTTINWSPASDALVFGERITEFLVDGDIWHFDIESGDLTNLTEDDYLGPLSLRSDEEYDPIPVDFAPAWSPDGSTIAFSRTTLTGADDSPTAMMLLDVASGEVIELAVFDEFTPFTLPFRMVWSPSGTDIYATALYPNSAEDRGGVWVFLVGSGKFGQIAGPNEDFDGAAPAIVAVSPVGDKMILSYPDYIATTTDTNRKSGYVLFDPKENSLTPIEPGGPFAGPNTVAVAPNFSPDGTALIYGVRGGSLSSGYVVASTIGLRIGEIFARLPDGTYPITLNPTLPMGVGGTVAFVQTAPSAGAVVPLPERMTEPEEASEPESGTTPEGEIDDSGTLIVGAHPAVLREGPSRDADIVAIVPAGESLSPLGEAFESDGLVWIEVEVISTGETGFIRTDFLEPSD